MGKPWKFHGNRWFLGPILGENRSKRALATAPELLRGLQRGSEGERGRPLRASFTVYRL